MIYDKTTFANALMFDYAYGILYDEFQDGIKSNDMKKIGLLGPLVVNCAFSCELFLKAMLPSGTRGHKLNKDLFKHLDDRIAKNIKVSVIKIMCEHNENYSEIDFEKDLIKNEEAFERWRYFHEAVESIGFDIKFMNVFQRCIKTIAVVEDKTN